MSGPHVEYYSYSFFLENLIGDQYPPFTKTEYYPISGDEEPPCAATENWVRLDKSYGLYFSCWDALKLEIYFEEAKNAAIPDDIGEARVLSPTKMHTYLKSTKTMHYR